MTVIITTFTYPPSKDGVAEATRTLAEGLAERGWQVYVATGKPENDNNFYDQNSSVSIARFDLDNSGKNSTEEVERYRRWIVSTRADLLVSQCWDVWSTELLSPIRQQIKCPAVMVSHGYSRQVFESAPPPGFGIGVWLRGLRWTFAVLPREIRSHDALVFLSKKSDFGRFFDHLLAKLMGHRRIHYIPNAVNPDKFNMASGEFIKTHSIPTGKMVLCVANYCSRKNQKRTVTVFRKANIPGSTLVLIGSDFNGYDEETMKLDAELAEKYNASNVVFIEKLSREETFRAFLDADIFLLTAKVETQPIVLIEAMTAGLPWISTRTGCVQNMPGGIVAGSDNGLIVALKCLATDHSTWKKLSDQGKLASRTKYGREECLRQFDEIFSGLVLNSAKWTVG